MASPDKDIALLSLIQNSLNAQQCPQLLDAHKYSCIRTWSESAFAADPARRTFSLAPLIPATFAGLVAVADPRIPHLPIPFEQIMLGRRLLGDPESKTIFPDCDVCVYCFRLSMGSPMIFKAVALKCHGKTMTMYDFLRNIVTTVFFAIRDACPGLSNIEACSMVLGMYVKRVRAVGRYGSKVFVQRHYSAPALPETYILPSPPSNTYVPPANTYVPPANTYIPPAHTYVPPAPPSSTYVPPVETYVPPSWVENQIQETNTGTMQAVELGKEPQIILLNTTAQTATSSGGYGSAEVWSNRAQRGSAESAMTGNQTSGGLIDQALNSTNLKSELVDAKQGVDEDTRREVEPLNPYGKSSLDSNFDARQHLADAFSNS
ncbi:hypothetical protein EYR36_001781 [Pleurotus pulmonarius]|nr:hypothetical protein EYR36_001781 [Pleurotus pulmonarius]